MWTLWLTSCALTRLSAVGRSYPTIDGEIEVSAHAPAAELRIVRDLYGVPHIDAANEADAWWALGFVHAQDRLFSADLQRHLGWGTLSAWFGEDTADYDAFAQALDLRGRASSTLTALAPATRDMLDAYAEGMNAGAASLRVLPIEYRLLKQEFEPWEPVDAFAGLYLMSWNLQENLAYELAAVELRELPAATLDALLRSEPEVPPIDPYWDELRAAPVGEWTAPFRAWTDLLGGAPRAGASNAWVVRGEGGAPIVANDPHLTQRVPALWYAADLRGGGVHVAGATLPGVPGVIIGHTEGVAWGLTNVMADLVDVAVVARSAGGVTIAGQVEPLRAVGPVSLTSIGPVISEPTSDHLLVMRWSALSGGDHTLDLLREIALADSVDALLAVNAQRDAIVVENVLLADTAGHMAWTTTGPVPRRRGFSGRVPYPASDAAYGWDGWISERPEVRDPDGGVLVNANDRPDHPVAGAWGAAWVPAHRRERIEERIAAVSAHTRETESQLQVDVQDRAAVWHRDRLLAGVAPATTAGAQCLDLLAGWDLNADRASAGAAVWAVFLDRYLRLAIADDLGPDAVATAMSVLSEERSPLDNPMFEATFVQDRRATVAAALEQTCQALSHDLGPDPALWRWGDVHPLRLEHPFTAQAPKLLRSWSTPTLSWAGSGTSVAAAHYGWSGGTTFPVGTMQSMRIVMPLDDLGASTFVQPGGQSGQPHADLAFSHLPHFVGGETLPLWFDPDDVAANARWTVTVRPVP